MEDIFNYPENINEIGGGDISISRNENNFTLSINCNQIFPTLQGNIMYVKTLNNQLYKWLNKENLCKQYDEKMAIIQNDIEIYKCKNGYYQIYINDKIFNNVSITYCWLSEVINKLENNPEKYYKNFN